MGILDTFSGIRRIDDHRPWPRAVVGTDAWLRARSQLAQGLWELVALWGERDAVHVAVRNASDSDLAVLTLECADGRYPSVAQVHPPALRLERAARDLFGLEPEGLPDARPWLDHGRWDVAHPLGRWESAASGPKPYAFLPAEGESLHRIGVGPVHAGIIEPGYFQFTANGETIVRLEERLGYAHKGIERLMQGADLDRGLRLAGRMSGDSTVAYGYAFARAAEAALGIEPPPRAIWLRALMAELERIANHFGDFGAICNDAGFAIMQAQCAVMRECVLRTSGRSFGHRMMRDCIVVGGVGDDLDGKGAAEISGLMTEIAKRLPRLAELYDKTASLQDRTVGTGILKPDLAQQYACGGFVGRASGRPVDARKRPAYPPYDQIVFDVPVLDEGDVNARTWIRIREIEQSVSIIRQILDQVPQGDCCDPVRLSAHSCEGASLIEGFRGDMFVWLRIGGDGTIARCHLRDPSWFQWPLLEAAIEGNIVADFPLCNKSFNCSYSGHDL